MSLALGHLATFCAGKKDVDNVRRYLVECRDAILTLCGPDHGDTDAANRAVAEL
jgi:hypothetical protein